MRKHLMTREFRELLIGLGLEPNIKTPEEYLDALKAQMAWNVSTIDMLKKKGAKFDF